MKRSADEGSRLKLRDRGAGRVRFVRALVPERFARELPVPRSQLPKHDRSADFGALSDLPLARRPGSEHSIHDVPERVCRAEPDAEPGLRLLHASNRGTAAVCAGAKPTPHLARMWCT